MIQEHHNPMDFVAGKQLGSTLSRTRKVGIYSQGAGAGVAGSVDGKLLRILTRLLQRASQGDQTSSGGWWGLRNSLGMENGEFWLNCLSRSLAIIVPCRNEHRSPKVKA